MTIADVAREAGCSINTVSRALNGKPDVNQATRRRIAAVAERLGYVPSRAARTLATGRTRTLGLLVTNPATPVYARLIAAVEASSRAADHALLLYSSGEDPAQEAAGVRLLRECRVEGLLAVPTPGTRAVVEAASALPVVLLLRDVPEARLDTVTWDNVGGARAAVEHLLALGHRRIGYVGHDLAVSTVTARRAGYRQALTAAGIRPRPAWEAEVPLTPAAACAATQALLGHAPELTALFIGSDVLVPGVLAALRQAGRRVPRDVALVGFGNEDFAAFTEPPLTAIHPPVEEVAAAATARLLTRVRAAQEESGGDGSFPTGGAEGRPWRLELSPCLVVRESCGAAALAAAGSTSP